MVSCEVRSSVWLSVAAFGRHGSEVPLNNSWINAARSNPTSLAFQSGATPNHTINT